MNEQLIHHQFETKALDVTEKGIVTVGVNGIGIEDYQHDISMPGSFKETLKNDINKMRWFLNHDMRLLLGVPLSGEERDDNVIMTGQLNLDKQIGRDILADYKLFRDAGRTLEHSIGVRAIERDKQDKRKVLKWFMGEYSTLTSWGANPQTFLVGIKSGTQSQLMEAVDFIRMAFKQHGYSDERLKNYEMELNLLLKALSGGTIVTCPHCGYQFDYDAFPEITFSVEVQEAASEMMSAIARNEARAQIERYRPEIQQEVTALIDGLINASDKSIAKGITDAFHFVRCPHCWSRVFKNSTVLVPEDTSKAKDDEEPEDNNTDNEEEEDKQKSAIPSPSFWAQLNDNLKK